jgi:dTDP-4-dehydrorhamnose reductase
VEQVLHAIKPSAVVNLIALSNVDACEKSLSAAYQTNVRCVETIATVIMGMSKKPHLIQISTDHLYQGVGPHDEGSAFPINVYALTKLTGEWVAQQASATILRTNFFGKSQHSDRRSFSDWIYESLILKREFTVFDDVYFSALNMQTLSASIAQAIAAQKPGVFNLGTRDGISKAEFAKKFAACLHLDTRHMRIGSHRDVQLTAPRPTDMRLHVARFERAFNTTLPSMDHQIQEAAQRYKGELK